MFLNGPFILLSLGPKYVCGHVIHNCPISKFCIFDIYKMVYFFSYILLGFTQKIV